MKAEEESFTSHGSRSQNKPSTDEVHRASITCRTKTHPFCRKKKCSYWELYFRGRKKSRYKCALQCLLDAYKYNDVLKVYIYGNKALFGSSILNEYNALYILVYYKAVLRQV